MLRASVGAEPDPCLLGWHGLCTQGPRGTPETSYPAEILPTWPKISWTCSEKNLDGRHAPRLYSPRKWGLTQNQDRASIDANAYWQYIGLQVGSPPSTLKSVCVQGQPRAKRDSARGLKCPHIEKAPTSSSLSTAGAKCGTDRVTHDERPATLHHRTVGKSAG